VRIVRKYDVLFWHPEERDQLLGRITVAAESRRDARARALQQNAAEGRFPTHKATPGKARA
jgi:hypothetical protein